MTTIGNKLQLVRARIAQACEKSHRPPSAVRLLAVSKTFDAQAVREAAAAGQRDFGENYLQEAVAKIEALPGLGLQWHCIGPVQSNKSRLVAQHFDWLHTLDRLALAQRLSDLRPPGRAPLNVCLQVNIDAAPTKSGLAPAQALELAQAVLGLPGLRLRGLMAIPDPVQGFEAQCASLAPVQALFDVLRAGLPAADQTAFDTLSLGMSGDLEAAIACGSTLVRVGTAIFGQR